MSHVTSLDIVLKSTNHKYTDQTARICRLISVFVVRKQHTQVFSHRGEIIKTLSLSCSYLLSTLGYVLMRCH